MTDYSTKQVIFVNEQKKCKIQDVKNIIKFDKFYEIEITELEYTYEDFLQITNTFVIPDLIKIVYNYLDDRKTICVTFMWVMWDVCGIEAYYLFDNVLYQYYRYYHYDVYRYGIVKNTCPKIIKQFLDKNVQIHECTCSNRHRSVIIKKNSEDCILCEHYIPELQLMYEIFICIVRHQMGTRLLKN